MGFLFSGGQVRGGGDGRVRGGRGGCGRFGDGDEP